MSSPALAMIMKHWYKGERQELNEKGHLDLPFNIEAFCREMDEKITDLGKLFKIACQEWAEDHTYLQELCLKEGLTEDEVYGDSYGVPGIQDLVEMLVRKIKEGNGSAAPVKGIPCV